MPETTCSTCDNPAFAKGLCNRCYHEQWRRSKGTGPRLTLTDRTCSVAGCDEAAYHDHPQAGVLCRVHDDRYKRRGTTDLVDRSKPKPPCELDGCKKPQHSKGMCQAHYRKFMKYGDPFAGAQKLGRPFEGKGHLKLSEQEKQDRANARLEAFRSRTHCVHGHALTAENTYVSPNGKRICRACTSVWNGMSGEEVRVTPVRNKDKTHCPYGHEYTTHGRFKADGSRMCVPCTREAGLVRTYGLERGQYDQMLEAQGGCCAMCGDSPGDGENLHVDHSHATGKVRELLCSPCNRGIGVFEEDIWLLEAAIRYLKKHRNV